MNLLAGCCENEMTEFASDDYTIEYCVGHRDQADLEKCVAIIRGGGGELTFACYNMLR